MKIDQTEHNLQVNVVAGSQSRRTMIGVLAKLAVEWHDKQCEGKYEEKEMLNVSEKAVCGR